MTFFFLALKSSKNGTENIFGLSDAVRVISLYGLNNMIKDKIYLKIP